jgi:hypothetical protein
MHLNVNHALVNNICKKNSKISRLINNDSTIRNMLFIVNMQLILSKY